MHLHATILDVHVIVVRRLLATAVPVVSHHRRRHLVVSGRGALTRMLMTRMMQTAHHCGSAWTTRAEQCLMVDAGQNVRNGMRRGPAVSRNRGALMRWRRTATSGGLH